jgi:hypothetical protein
MRLEKMETRFLTGNNSQPSFSQCVVYIYWRPLRGLKLLRHCPQEMLCVCVGRGGGGITPD